MSETMENVTDKADTAAHTEDDGSLTKEPTEKETGVMTYKCCVCGRIMRKESIDALPGRIRLDSCFWKFSDHFGSIRDGE